MNNFQRQSCAMVGGTAATALAFITPYAALGWLIANCFIWLLYAFWCGYIRLGREDAA